MPAVYLYVVARDFGSAPNPFGGVCTLATCKPKIRRTAKIGDWIFGMGGKELQAVGRCIFAMQVTEAMTFDEYWVHPNYHSKRPVRNGSRKAMMGDNIYHCDPSDGRWRQADSHHSKPDGTVELTNLELDTSANRVLLSRQFVYFGRSAPIVPAELLVKIGYENRRDHRVYRDGCADILIDWLLATYGSRFNTVQDEPFHFRRSGARFSAGSNRILD